jgi:hypothetical protein
MARLYVDAVSAPVNASVGNRNPVHLGISVTDANGNGVAGLLAANFAIATPTVAPGGAAGVISSSSGTTITGGYSLQILPTGANNWQDGTYIFVIDVTSGVDDGQTVVNVAVP